MNELELLDKLALVYISKGKKAEHAYKQALEDMEKAFEAHRKLNTIIRRLKSRGEL